MFSRKTWTRSLGSLLTAVFLLPGAASAAAGWTGRGLQGLSISSLAVEPGNPSRIYAAAGAGGIYRSADGGASWSRVNFDASVEKVEVDARGNIYAIVGERYRQGLFWSSDHGTTWTQFNFFGELWTGREWLSSNVAVPVSSVAVNPKEAGVLHAGHSGASVSTSRDGGSTWSHSYFDYYCSDFCAEAITSLVLDPASPSTIYAGIDADFDYPGFASMFKSTDGGKNWKQSDEGIPLWASVYSIAVDPYDSQRVLAGSSGGYNIASPGTYLSEDAGRSWRRTSNSGARALVFDPWYPQVVYAATSKDGVLRSVDRGRNWSPMNSGLSSPSTLSLAVDRARGLLFAGTRDGIFSYPVADQKDAVIDVFDAGGTATGFLLLQTYGPFRLGTADGSGGKSLGSPYGPYAGWTPAAAERGADGLTRVLWSNDDGSAALWLTRPEGIQAAFLLPAQPGWTVRDVAAGAEGSTRILWTADASASLWTVSSSGVRTSDYGYGPFPGWTATAIAGGPDGRTRILWNNADGRAGVSFVDSRGLLATTRYGSEAGWSFVDLSVAADNRTRLLRSHQDGRIAVWTINADGEPVRYGVPYLPPPGFEAVRISAAADGSSGVLWRNSDGLALLWLLSADGEFRGSIPLN